MVWFRNTDPKDELGGSPPAPWTSIFIFASCATSGSGLDGNQAMAKPAYSALVQHVSSGSGVVYVPTRKHARLTALDLLTFAASDGAPKR